MFFRGLFQWSLASDGTPMGCSQTVMYKLNIKMPRAGKKSVFVLLGDYYYAPPESLPTLDFISSSRSQVLFTGHQVGGFQERSSCWI